MKIITHALAATAILAVSTPALAQSMTPGQTAPGATMGNDPTTAAPQPATPSTTPAAPQTASGPISDAEVGQFAKAVVALDAIQKDTTTPETEKQAKMAAKVQEHGLEPVKFNQIAQTAQSDPALQAKVQTAIQAEAGSAAAPTQ